MNIVALIGIMITIVIGVSLIGPINETAQQIQTPAYSNNIVSLVNILPIIFVTMIILGVVGWISCVNGTSLPSFCKRKSPEGIKVTIRRNKKELIIMLKRESKKISEYINNLDTVLSIKTINDESPKELYGLSLTPNKELYINPEFEWFITDKHPSMNMFKIAGLHKEDADKNMAYILGKDNEDKPYLIRIPKEYIENIGEDWTSRKILLM